MEKTVKNQAFNQNLERNNAQNGVKIKKEMKSGRSNGEKHWLLRKERNGQTNGSLIGTKDI